MKGHLVFAILLSVVLTISGFVSIPLTHDMEAADRNILFGMLRVPIILGSVFAYYGGHLCQQRVIGFSIMLTLVLMGTGVVTIPLISPYSHGVQNLIYAIGRVPLVFAVAYLVFGGTNAQRDWSKDWKEQ